MKKIKKVKKVIALYLSVIICLTNNIWVFAEDTQYEAQYETQETGAEISLQQCLIWGDTSETLTLKKKDGSYFSDTDVLSVKYLDETDKPEGEILNVIAEFRSEDKATYAIYEIVIA